MIMNEWYVSEAIFSLGNQLISIDHSLSHDLINKIKTRKKQQRPQQQQQMPNTKFFK